MYVLIEDVSSLYGRSCVSVIIALSNVLAWNFHIGRLSYHWTYRFGYLMFMSAFESCFRPLVFLSCRAWRKVERSQ
ncbi:hypothetical protein GYMLUDRAFT_900365 [Collybiopsis luxurians FD-317 M1]|uniref:Uncharacterized protein n=1 Tax=Collybiopsis luxurians FD-317 M1 TaxID=944289 RepID=A0A0D0CHV2_9AGAR|nr:hypothetical protein GYMLUDRAFT_900365 [Collybiopsis luxurians FD-317 M1]